MAYQTYLVSFKRTKFDIERYQKVMAQTPEEVRATMKELEGSRVIIKFITIAPDKKPATEGG